MASQMHYSTVDFYRFVAAFTVAFSHYLIAIHNSPRLELFAVLGVELFFPLSGFVLANQLSKVERNINLIKVFYLRRWMRTVPAYLVALISATIIFDSGEISNFLKFLTYTQNIISDNSFPNFFNVAWSLSVEEWFYLFMPILILILVKVNINLSSKLPWICLSVITIGLILKIVFSPSANLWGEEIRRTVVFRIDSLCYGVLTYIWKHKFSKNAFVITLIVFLSFLCPLLIDPNLLAENRFIQILFLPICSLSFSITLVFLSRIELNTILSCIGKFLANISYSVYLFHIIIIYFLQKFVPKTEFDIFIYLLILGLFSSLFYYFFEKPINNARPNY